MHTNDRVVILNSSTLMQGQDNDRVVILNSSTLMQGQDNDHSNT